MTTLTVIQARTGSTRLPGKALADIGGRTVLERVIERVRLTPADIGEIVVATSARAPDDPIAVLCNEIGVPCYRSSEHDVLNRFYQCAIHFGADVIVRVTADCPLLCPELLAYVVDVREALARDYVGVNGAPNGLAQEAMSWGALEGAWFDADDPQDREHVVTFVERRPKRFKLSYLEAEDWMQRRRHWRLTVDYPEDLDLLRRLFDKSDGHLFEMPSREILELVSAHRNLVWLAARDTF